MLKEQATRTIPMAEQNGVTSFGEIFPSQPLNKLQKFSIDFHHPLSDEPTGGYSQTPHLPESWNLDQRTTSLVGRYGEWIDQSEGMRDAKNVAYTIAEEGLRATLAFQDQNETFSTVASFHTTTSLALLEIASHYKKEEKMTREQARQMVGNYIDLAINSLPESGQHADQYSPLFLETTLAVSKHMQQRIETSFGIQLSDIQPTDFLYQRQERLEKFIEQSTPYIGTHTSEVGKTTEADGELYFITSFLSASPKQTETFNTKNLAVLSQNVSFNGGLLITPQEQTPVSLTQDQSGVSTVGKISVAETDAYAIVLPQNWQAILEGPRSSEPGKVRRNLIGMLQRNRHLPIILNGEVINRSIVERSFLAPRPQEMLADSPAVFRAEQEEKYPEIKQLMLLEAGIKEGITIGQHTEMVLGNLIMYYGERLKRGDFLLSYDAAKTLAFGHDGAKGVAVEITRDRSQQHSYNNTFLDWYTEREGYEEYPRQVILELNKHENDWFGRYIMTPEKQESSKEKVTEDMIAVAKTLGLTTREGFNLLRDTALMRYFIDVTAYTGSTYPAKGRRGCIEMDDIVSVTKDQETQEWQITFSLTGNNSGLRKLSEQRGREKGNEITYHEYVQEMINYQNTLPDTVFAA